MPDTRGHKGMLLNYPDDSHLLDDGMFLTADIRNCRVLIIDPKDNRIATQWGQAGQCKHNPPHQLAYPNGVTPMRNGDILVTEIVDSRISRITRAGQVLWSVRAPRVRYPSDAFPTEDGKQVILADFSKPGRVVIFDPATGKATWEYFVTEGDKMLDHPSIARELPDTGDIAMVDDLHDRVIVVDRKTRKSSGSTASWASRATSRACSTTPTVWTSMSFATGRAASPRAEAASLHAARQSVTTPRQVLPWRQGVSSLSTTCPAVLRCTRSWAKAGCVMSRHSRSSHRCSWASQRSNGPRAATVERAYTPSTAITLPWLTRWRNAFSGA
ncbi:MAG: PQQ-binding-like beta-propeller repeat protein [Rubrivivax sp.]|nr:PQQ-binding-like beta-propeller repeat protein [Rubrivivax sp.]